MTSFTGMTAQTIRNYIKTTVVGDGAVGKTCMLVSYATNKFPHEHVPTVFDNYAVTVIVAGTPYVLALFDTAGQEEYDRLRLLSYPGTDVFLLCFSVCNPDSFANVAEHWVPELRREAPGVPVLLVGTQSDCRADPKVIARLAKRSMKPVTSAEGHKLAKKIKAVRYMECSALTQQGLKAVFDEAIVSVLDPPKPQPHRPCAIL